MDGGWLEPGTRRALRALLIAPARGARPARGGGGGAANRSPSRRPADPQEPAIALAPTPPARCARPSQPGGTRRRRHARPGALLADPGHEHRRLEVPHVPGRRRRTTTDRRFSELGDHPAGSPPHPPRRRWRHGHGPGPHLHRRIDANDETCRERLQHVQLQRRRRAVQQRRQRTLDDVAFTNNSASARRRDEQRPGGTLTMTDVSFTATAAPFGAGLFTAAGRSPASG